MPGKIASMLLLLWVSMVFLPSGLRAQTDPDKMVKNVDFPAGKAETSISGSITGYQYIDYKLSANKGQLLTVQLKSKHTATYFNILPPGSQDVAIYNASINGLQYSGELTESGEYIIRVYMMRSAARRKEKSSFTLQVGLKAKP